MTRPSGNNQPWMNHTPRARRLPLMRRSGGSWPGGATGHRVLAPTAATMASPISRWPLPARATISWHPDTGSEYANLLLSCPTPTTIPVTGPDLPEWEQDALLTPSTRSFPPALSLASSTAPPTPSSPSPTPPAGRSPAAGSPGALPSLRHQERRGEGGAGDDARSHHGADDPFLINRDAKGPVRANHTRSLLRDFDSLIHIRRAGDTAKSGVTPPAWIWFLDTLPTDALDQLGTVRARALACHQDKQEKDELWFAQTTPVGVAAYTSGRHPEQAARVATTRGNAESSAQALGQALRRAWRGISPDSRSECPWTHTAIAAYWDQADALFWTGIEPGSEVADFTRLAVRIYDDATRTDASTPTGMLPIAQSRHILTQPPAIRRKKSE